MTASNPHIMVCVPDGDTMPRISRHARALAEAVGGRLSFVNIVDAKIETIARGNTITLHRINDESTSAAIARAADELGIDIVAADSQHLSMIGHLRGSTSLEVLRHTGKPLLVAGPHVDHTPTGEGFHIMICSDGSRSAEKILPKLSGVLAGGSIRSTLLRVHEPRLGDDGSLIELESCEDYVQGLRRKLPPTANVECHVSMVEGLESVPHAIIRLAAELGTDTIAMATRGEGKARHVLVGSVALAVAGHARHPVLLARG